MVTPVSDSSNRAKVKFIVSKSPGVHLRALQRMLGISFNSTRYNVARLRNNGQIQIVRNGNRVCLFPLETQSSEVLLYSTFREPAPRKIMLQILEKTQPLTSKQICEYTSLAKSTVSLSLRKLCSLGVLQKSNSESSVSQYAPINREEFKAILDRTRETRYEVITSRFISLWDF
jgi:predicted transcriptional regulator